MARCSHVVIFHCDGHRKEKVSSALTMVPNCLTSYTVYFCLLGQFVHIMCNLWRLCSASFAVMQGANVIGKPLCGTVVVLLGMIDPCVLALLLDGELYPGRPDLSFRFLLQSFSPSYFAKVHTLYFLGEPIHWSKSSVPAWSGVWWLGKHASCSLQTSRSIFSTCPLHRNESDA